MNKPVAIMEFLSYSLFFAAVSGLFLASGVSMHVVRFHRGKRTPVQLLRAMFAGSLISAGVGILLLGDSLFA